MKKLLVLLVAASALLSGCVGYAGPYDNGPVYRGDGGGGPPRAGRDNDGDGVRNRRDRRPNNPERY